MKTNTFLWLDDARDPATWVNHDGDVVWVKSYDEFTTWITDNGLPDIVSFDHDLGVEHYEDIFGQMSMGIENAVPHYEVYTEKTGLDAAKWLAEYCNTHRLFLPTYRIHSHNRVGAENIETYLRNAKYHYDI